MGLLLLLPLLAFPWVFAWVEARKDAKRADRWDHFMKDVFHMKYGFLRGLLLVLVAMVGAFPSQRLGIALMVYNLCVFGFGFTYWLNTRRGKDPFYQSRQPDAANTDQAFVQAAAHLGTTPEALARIAYSLMVALSGLYVLLTWILSKKPF